MTPRPQKMRTFFRGLPRYCSVHNKTVQKPNKNRKGIGSFSSLGAENGQCSQETKMKKILTSKVIILLVLLFSLCTVLTSCFGGGQATVKITDVSVNDNEGLTQDQLNAIATLVRNNSGAWNDFVAAYRGYDVLGADGSLESYPGIKGEDGSYVVNVEAAKKVLAKYDGEKTLTYDKLDAEDIKNIVTAMQIDVSFEAKRDLFGNIQYYIGVALKWITSTVGFGNYLVGLCIFAILVEILMIPLTVKQQKNSIKQAMLRPKEQAIRNHYKGRNDQSTQQKVNEEIQALYERENFNPMAGCLPMLVQLPVIMILYNIVIDPIQYVLGGTASFAEAIKLFFTASRPAGGLGLVLNSKNGTIEVLSQIKNVDFSAIREFLMISDGEGVFTALESVADHIPSFNVGPINFGFTPSLEGNFGLLVVPVLTFVIYFFSMRISKKFTYQATTNEQAPGAGCSSKMMDFYMPAMSTVFCFMVPGAIGIYWVFRSVISTLKQFIMSKVMPLPVFTEEDYRAAEKEMYSKTPQRKRKNAPADLDPNRVRPRSLHHIDDEEEYPTFVNKDNKEN